MKKLKKKDKILLGVTAVVFISALIFAICFWNEVYHVVDGLLNGVDKLGDYIRGLGIVGIIIMMLIMILLFFFPVISSLPVQLACGIAYGIFGGGLIVWISMTTASQLLYLLRQDLKLFSSPKQLEKRVELEKLIAESDRNIYWALIFAYILPAVPFLIISNLAASGLKYPKYTLVTTLGMVPDILVTLFLGEKLLSSSPIASVITLFAIIVIIVLSIVFNDKIVRLVFTKRKKRKAESNDGE